MPTLFDKLMKEYPQASYSEWNKLNEIYKKFGDAALQKELQSKNAGQVYDLLRDQVINSNALFNSAVDEIHNLYKKVEQQLSLNQAPRAKPALNNQPNSPENVAASAGQAHKPNPWLRNVDEAADPKVRDAAIRLAAENIANNPRSFTEQFNNVVKAEAAYRLALKIQPKMSPKLQPEYTYQTPKPRPN